MDGWLRPMLKVKKNGIRPLVEIVMMDFGMAIRKAMANILLLDGQFHLDLVADLVIHG